MTEHDGVMTELLPCPFCGGDSEMSWRYRLPGYRLPGEGTRYWVRCCACNATTTAYDDEAEAIRAWNTRADYDRGYRDGIMVWSRYERDR
ncbi:MAG: Lar family restriction alleviation protein [Atopobiaceae bacterium]|nr:Lar family restriction alleviation protein [Atopobiaceae bacterium]